MIKASKAKLLLSDIVADNEDIDGVAVMISTRDGSIVASHQTNGVQEVILQQLAALVSTASHRLLPPPSIASTFAQENNMPSIVVLQFDRKQEAIVCAINVDLLSVVYGPASSAPHLHMISTQLINVLHKAFLQQQQQQS